MNGHISHSHMDVFIHLFAKYLLSAHQIPGIIDVLDKYQFIRNLDSLLEADKWTINKYKQFLDAYLLPTPSARIPILKCVQEQT